jgi:hypothetical protein
MEVFWQTQNIRVYIGYLDIDFSNLDLAIDEYRFEPSLFIFQVSTLLQ